MELTVIDDSNFDKEINEVSGLILIDAGAEWCSPCKAQLPIIEKFAKDNPTIKVCKADVDDCPNMSAKYSIRSVPTLMLFRDGKLLKQRSGLATMADVKSFMTV